MASSSCSFSARVQMPLSNSRLVKVLLPMVIFQPCASRASDIILSREALKRVGERRQTCLTLTAVLNQECSNQIHTDISLKIKALQALHDAPPLRLHQTKRSSLISARRPVMLYIFTKFCKIIWNDIKVIECT